MTTQISTPAQGKVFSGNKIHTQLHKYLAEHPEENVKDVKEKIYALGINYKKLQRFINNTQQPDLEEAAVIATVLKCSIDDLIK